MINLKGGINASYEPTYVLMFGHVVLEISECFLLPDPQEIQEREYDPLDMRLLHHAMYVDLI